MYRRFRHSYAPPSHRTHLFHFSTPLGLASQWYARKGEYLFDEVMEVHGEEPLSEWKLTREGSIGRSRNGMVDHLQSTWWSGALELTLYHIFPSSSTLVPLEIDALSSGKLDRRGRSENQFTYRSTISSPSLPSQSTLPFPNSYWLSSELQSINSTMSQTQVSRFSKQLIF